MADLQIHCNVDFIWNHMAQLHNLIAVQLLMKLLPLS